MTKAEFAAREPAPTKPKFKAGKRLREWVMNVRILATAG